ncbi:MAG: hypothetical protein LH472_14245 [Pyrinomonadaceae bacterium]|nr:hypothetical protein [Pyrinomonadaceae bacterium]
MKISRTKSIFGWLLMVIFLNACSGNKSENSNAAPNANRASVQTIETNAQDNVEELAKIVKLPRPPEEATYNEINLPAKNAAPNEKRLVAVLKFSPEDAAAIAAAAEKYQPPVASDIDAETWFPPELVAKSQETGDEFLKGIEYAANDFVQSPYLNGKLTRLNDTNYFVLELVSF